MKYLLKRILQTRKAQPEDWIVNTILILFFVAFLIVLQVLGS